MDAALDIVFALVMLALAAGIIYVARPLFQRQRRTWCTIAIAMASIACRGNAPEQKQTHPAANYLLTLLGLLVVLAWFFLAYAITTAPLDPEEPPDQPGNGPKAPGSA